MTGDEIALTVLAESEALRKAEHLRFSLCFADKYILSSRAEPGLRVWEWSVSQGMFRH